MRIASANLKNIDFDYVVTKLAFQYITILAFEFFLLCLRFESFNYLYGNLLTLKLCVLLYYYRQFNGHNWLQINWYDETIFSIKFNNFLLSK